MNYHSHEHRNEVWNVISGEGKVIIDEKERRIIKGDVISMSVGCKHTVIADTELQIIEEQLGNDIRATDKRKYTCPTN